MTIWGLKIDILRSKFEHGGLKIEPGTSKIGPEGSKNDHLGGRNLVLGQVKIAILGSWEVKN